MLDPNLSNLPEVPRPQPPIGHVDLAKWPPDDDDDMPGAPPPGGGAPAGGGFDSGDGNFKKGRFNPIAIIIGILVVVGGIAFLAIGVKQDAKKLTIEQAEAQKKAIFVLPKPEQIPKWRKWAASDQSGELKMEALKQLAWAKDPAGVDLAIKALHDTEPRVVAMAATALAEYGSPMADKAKEPLLKSLKTAGVASRPQIAWAEVVLGDSRAFDEVMKLYRIGHLSKVQRLGGGVAFDPNMIVKLVSLDKLASLAGDKSDAVRQLVATVLSRKADPKYTDALIKLVKDKDEEVARQAAPGLGKIGDERARGPLLDALKGADKDSRKKYLEALRDGIGDQGLVLALQSNRPERREEGLVPDQADLLDDPRARGSARRRLPRQVHRRGSQAAHPLADRGGPRHGRGR